MPTTIPPAPSGPDFPPAGPGPTAPDLPPDMPAPPPEKGPPDPIGIPSPNPDSIDDPLMPEPIGIPGAPQGDVVPAIPGAVVF